MSEDNYDPGEIAKKVSITMRGYQCSLAGMSQYDYDDEDDFSPSNNGIPGSNMNLKSRVKIINVSNPNVIRCGTIIGLGSIVVNSTTMELSSEARSVFLVFLDEGFFDRTESTYVSTVVVDSSALELLPSNNG